MKFQNSAWYKIARAKYKIYLPCKIFLLSLNQQKSKSVARADLGKVAIQKDDHNRQKKCSSSIFKIYAKMCIYKLIIQSWSMITQNFLTLDVGGAILGSGSRYPEPPSESTNAA